MTLDVFHCFQPLGNLKQMCLTFGQSAQEIFCGRPSPTDFPINANTRQSWADAYQQWWAVKASKAFSAGLA